MIRYTISAPELEAGVCYRTLHFSTPATAENRAEQLAAQIATIPTNELQRDGVAVLFGAPFTHPLTMLETFTLTEAFGNQDLQWGVRENDEIDMLVTHIYIPDQQ